VNQMRQSILLFCVLAILFGQAYAAGSNFDQLMESISKSNPEEVKKILKDSEKGKINLDEKGADGWSPLCLAAAKGNAEIVQVLLDHGADLAQSMTFKNKRATPFILAAQYGHFDVIKLLMESPYFTPDKRKEEIRNANAFGQPELAKQVLMIAQNLRVGGSESPPCGQKVQDEFAHDIKAQSYRLMDVSCEICLGLPGEDTKTKLIDGSSHTGNSAITNCCGQFFCASCVGKTKTTQGKCSHCRQPLSFKVFPNAIAEFHWHGSDKVPLPGQAVDEESVGSEARVETLPAASSLATNEGVSAPVRRANLQILDNSRERQSHYTGVNHQVLGPNSRFGRGLVWSDAMEITVTRGVINRTIERVWERKQKDAFEDCLKLNPKGERAVIRADLVAGRRPARGYFLPRKEDWEEINLRDFPNLRGKLFWSSSVSPNNADYAYVFNGDGGFIGLYNRYFPRSVVCVGVR